VAVGPPGRAAGQRRVARSPNGLPTFTTAPPTPSPSPRKRSCATGCRLSAAYATSPRDEVGHPAEVLDRHPGRLAKGRHRGVVAPGVEAAELSDRGLGDAGDVLLAAKYGWDRAYEDATSHGITHRSSTCGGWTWRWPTGGTTPTMAAPGTPPPLRDDGLLRLDRFPRGGAVLDARPVEPAHREGCGLGTAPGSVDSCL
jgi:hypothetical protein